MRGRRARGVRPALMGAIAFGLLAWAGCASGPRTASPETARPTAHPDVPDEILLPGQARDTLRPIGRPGVDALRYPPLELDPPVAAEHELMGVPVYHLHDPAFPLVDVFVQVRGGVSHFPRERMGPLTGLTAFVRNGGTVELPPDSVERREDLLALQFGFGAGGGGSYASLNSLRATLDEGLELFRDMLTRPGFDREAVEVWLGQERERVRRRADNPGSLAYSEFNRLMFGDHPVGWVMEEADLAPERYTTEQLRALHRTLYCRERLIVGVAGDLTWDEAEPRIRAFLEAWPPCEEELAEAPEPRFPEGGRIYILPREVAQTTIVMAHPGGLRQEDAPQYFASRVANLILGGGGFTSRLMTRLRTERGLTYGASSLWTTPMRYEGVVGAVTTTTPERTVEAVELMLEILDEFRTAPPDEDEVTRAVEQISNSYVFAFESARQIVARRMGDRALGLPEGWLERYLEGVQEVSPEEVFQVASRHIDPARMTILLVGDPDRFDPGIERLGPLYRVSLDGRVAPWEGDPPGGG